MTAQSPLERLAKEPERFSFDAAVRLLCADRATADPAEAARFHAPHGLAYPPADVLRFDPASPGAQSSLTVGLIGLTGPSGVLPRHYSEAVVQQVRTRARSLPAFLDMLAQRMIAHFAAAGVKYREHRDADAALFDTDRPEGRFAAILVALAGYGTPDLLDRVAAGADPIIHYAGLFATRPRSADRLQALVSDWLGQPVEVVQFAGAWLPIAPDQRTRLPVGIGTGRFARLGSEATIGVRAWDPSARIVLRLGPMSAEAFDLLLPDRDALVRLVSLVRAFLGLETGFAINPVIDASEVPPLRLDAGAEPPPRLGWNTWLPAAARRRHGTEAVFEAEVVEFFHRAPPQRAASAEAQHTAAPAGPGTA